MRRHRGGYPARERRDGRTPGRPLEGDDVRRAGAQGDSLKGHVPRGHEPDRLAFTVTDRPGEEAHEVVTVVLGLGDGRTKMRMTQTGGGLSPEGYEAAKRGWGGFFDRPTGSYAGPQAAARPSPTSPRTSSAWRRRKAGPTPLMLESSAALAGRASAIASSVALLATV